jgi:hypothetical protein
LLHGIRGRKNKYKIILNMSLLILLTENKSAETENELIEQRK